jgi:hypothetical protein
MSSLESHCGLSGKDSQKELSGKDSQMTEPTGTKQNSASAATPSGSKEKSTETEKECVPGFLCCQRKTGCPAPNFQYKKIS